jgi:hypothetical protein
MANQEDWISEEEIANALNIQREKTRAARPQLGPGEVKEEKKVVLWLRSTAVAFARSMGLDWPFEKKPAAVAPGLDIEELTVVSRPMANGWHFGNRQLIRAQRPNGELVIVRVADSRKYMPQLANKNPMKLKAVPATSGQWWIHVGREPRYAGIW